MSDVPGTRACRIIMAYGNYRKGDIIYPAHGSISMMIARGRIEEVIEEPEEDEEPETREEAIAPLNETADLNPKRKRRKYTRRN